MPGRTLSRFVVSAAVLAVTTSALAAVTELAVKSHRPFGTFAAGDYLFIEATVRGELDPREPIPGLDQAPRNAEGHVEYSTRLVLIAPEYPQRSNGTLIVDIPNRGRAYAQALFNSPRDDPFQSGAFEQGTGFLQDRGFMVAEIYWEAGHGADVPSFVDTEGKRRFVEGAAFAIVRDVADYLRYGIADQKRNGNPLRGAVRQVIATGKSQAGRFLKTFMVKGFNSAGGRRVFDGLEIITSAGMLPIWTTGTSSGGDVIPTFDAPDVRGYTEEPIAYASIFAAIPPQNEALPKIMFLNSTTDYHAIRNSLSRTGATGTAELRLPSNVRIYDIAGAAHTITRSAPACATPPGGLDWTPVSRALLLRLDAWVAADSEPPPSRQMPLEVAAADAALRAPAYLPGAVIQVPRRDADGNAVGGVRLPDVEAPLGTYLALNATRTRGCMLVGGWSPFAATRAQREAAGDARLSIAERYRDRDDYVNRVRAATRTLAGDGFLLPEDAVIIVQAAASSRAFAKPSQGAVQ